jgi:dolichol-phosphate mannosyltransferase
MEQRRDFTVYVMLPAYNEEASLEKMMGRIQPVMNAGSIRYQVVIVNDGSTDKTLEVAQRLSKSFPIQIMNHERNKGLGAAINTGLSKIRDLSRPGDVIITMDADDTHPPDLIPIMIEKLQGGYDLVIASRYVEGAQEVGLSFRRKVLSRGASTLLKALFPIKGLADYTCGYRAYRADMVKKAFANHGEMFVREKGFTAIVEILLKLRNLNVTACEVPLILRYDQKVGASKMPVMKTILRYGTLIVHNLFTPRTKPS